MNYRIVRPIFFSLAVALMGCGQPGEEERDAGGVDTGTATATDTGADTGADTGVDTGEIEDAEDVGEVRNDLQVAVRFAGEAEPGWRVGAFLTHYEEASGIGGGIVPLFRHEYVSVPLDDSSVILTIEEPDQESVGEIIEGASGAGWLIAIYDDREGNGRYDEGDPIEGISTTLVLYPEEDIETEDHLFQGQEWTAIDKEKGFDWLTVDLEEELTVDPMTLRRGLAMKGTIDEAMLASVTHIGSVVQGGNVADHPPISQPLTTSTWELEVQGALDSRRHQESSSGGPIFSEIPVVYEALDGDGVLEESDQIRGSLCHEGSSVYLIYVEEILDPAEAITVRLSTYGLHRGWSVLVFEETGLVSLAEEFWEEFRFEPGWNC